MTTTSGTVYFHYNGDKVVYETDSSNNIIAEYTWDAQGNPATITKNGATYYYHINGHGDVVALTDESGSTVAQYQYDAWGNILSQSGSKASDNLYRYAGYRYDEVTELYYLMARYYNPEIGRFITRDTFHGFEDDPLSLNQYAYTANNPVMYVDPDEHSYERIKFAVKYGLKYWLSHYVGWSAGAAIIDKAYALGFATVSGTLAYQLKFTSLTSVTQIGRVLKYEMIRTARTIALRAALKVGVKVLFPASILSDAWHLGYGIYLGWKSY